MTVCQQDSCCNTVVRHGQDSVPVPRRSTRPSPSLSWPLWVGVASSEGLRSTREWPGLCGSYTDHDALTNADAQSTEPHGQGPAGLGRVGAGGRPGTALSLTSGPHGPHAGGTITSGLTGGELDPS